MLLGGDRKGCVPQVPQRVVTATHELARNRKEGKLAIEALFHGAEVLMIGRAGPACVDSRLVEGPSQHRWTLFGEMAAGLLAVGGVDRHVQPGVADGVD